MEYHYHALPLVAQAAYAQRHIASGIPEPVIDPATSDAALTGRAQLERDARLHIVGKFARFSRGLKVSKATTLQIFCDRYNAGHLQIEDWVRDSVPSLSKRSLIRWQSAKHAGRSIGHDPAIARKGTGALETANNGEVRAFILGLIAHQPFVSAHHVRTLCRDQFGDTITIVSKGVQTPIDMPPVRTFQHALKLLKERHKVELIKITNPDLYRSTLAPAGVGTLRHITKVNQLWQIDASPVDALCTDGRHSIYVCIDIASRRQVFFVARTPRASAVALLIRKSIIAWGVPDVIKTDNGSDFTARDTQRLFASLGIDPDVSDAYSPEQKGHVERAIKTFQHDVGPLLPGFVGHSVADRKSIESRKSFADRLGASDAEVFGVALTGQQLAGHIDEWAELMLQHRPHAGLRQQTPFLAAQACSRQVRTVDLRALDLLLMPVADGHGRRTVTKRGIRIEGHHFMTTAILPGTEVFVRQDPNDLGIAYCFAPDGGTYLGDAICPELRGLDPELVARERKALQREIVDARAKPIKDEARRIARGKHLIERVLDVARRDAPNVVPLPKREVPHSTPQISAAIEAMGDRLNPAGPTDEAGREARRRLIEQMAEDEALELERRTHAMLERRQREIEAARTAHLPATEKVVALPETPKERYRRALKFQALADEGQLPGVDGIWLGRYVEGPEFKGQRLMHEEYGDAYLS